MLAIFKKALLFADYVPADRETAFTLLKPKRKFLAHPSREPQQAPEWIRKTSAFKLASKEGSVIEVVANGSKADRIDWPEPDAGDVPRMPTVPVTATPQFEEASRKGKGARAGR